MTTYYTPAIAKRMGEEVAFLHVDSPKSGASTDDLEAWLARRAQLAERVAAAIEGEVRAFDAAKPAEAPKHGA